LRLVLALALIGGLALGALLGALVLWLWARGEIARRDVELAASRRDDGRWEEHLKALTADALSSSSTSLLELAEAKLQPIKETLTRFEQQSRLLEERRLAAVGAIPQLIEGLRKETGSLVTALRTPHVRGGWGELQLKRVIELAGMLSHCDFFAQASERDGEGKLLRPDVVVKLPGGKNIVVDSKAPLEAYLDALDADDEATRAAQLARHARLVREHVTKLGQKRYWQQFEPAPEFVVMFVDEGLFRAALDQDPALFEAGVDAGVIIASPATLIALLRTVAYTWQQETVAESARAVNQLGRELYDRLRTFAKPLAKVGRQLDSAVAAFNDAVGSFESRVLVTARKFPEHGAGSDELPELAPVERQARRLHHELEEGDDVVTLPTRAA
jgi:DNA recombination protein RmuC